MTRLQKRKQKALLKQKKMNFKIDSNKEKKDAKIQYRKLKGVLGQPAVSEHKIIRL